MAKELLKEAIADAKAVREVALQNAKMALEEAYEDVELEEEYVEEEVETTDEAVETTDEGYYEEDDKDVKKEEVELEEDIDEEINLDELMAELEEMSYMEDDDDMKKEGEDIELEEGDETLNEIDPSTTELIAGALTGLGVSTAMFNAAGGTSKLKQMLSKAGSSPKDKAKALRDFLGLMGGQASKSISNAPLSGQEPGSIGTNESFDIDALISEIEAELDFKNHLLLQV